MLRRVAFAIVLAGSPVSAQEPMEPLQAFVRAHCVECHGGETTKGKLDFTRDAGDAVASLWRWRCAAERVRCGEMPPADAAMPTAAQRDAFLQAVAAKLRTDVPLLAPDPGRVTVRRLSRSQWANCVMDLFGVEVATSGFPADDLGYGFDTIGDALTFSTLHLENYLAGARQVAAAVLHGEDPQRPAVRHFDAEAMTLSDGAKANIDADSVNLLTRATLRQVVALPRDGVYRLRIVAGGDQAGDEPAKMHVQLDGRDFETIEVEQRELRAFEVTAPLRSGRREFALTFVNDIYLPEHPDPTRRDRNLRIGALEVIGPLDARVVPPAQQWLHEAIPARANESGRLGTMVRALLPRVWRRPATDVEVARFVDTGVRLRRQGESSVAVQRFLLQAALASPSFLFRGEPALGDVKAGAAAPLPGPALATRLSFFLWASTPDAELLATAPQLSSPAVLKAQTDRLLADARADRLATEFAAMWLELRNLAERTPDPARFPGFDDALRASMRRETELLFLAVLREDRDVRELLDCGFTHVDARLASFYGLPVPAADAGFVRVELPAGQRERGGVLGHASILAVTSNPTRTSPVKRGKWILENLLGQPPPPPPPGNDSLANEASIDSSKTFREQLAQHRQRATCASCHVRMDALGFALENYDAIGRHRLADAGGPIDSTGELPDGTRLDGLGALKATLVRDGAFLRTLAAKLFVYAVGRDLRPVDRLRLDHAVAGLEASGKVTLRDLVHVVVGDVAFRCQAVAAGR